MWLNEKNPTTSASWPNPGQRNLAGIYLKTSHPRTHPKMHQKPTIFVWVFGCFDVSVSAYRLHSGCCRQNAHARRSKGPDLSLSCGTSTDLSLCVCSGMCS